MWAVLNCPMRVVEGLKGLWRVVERLAWGHLETVERLHPQVYTDLSWLPIRLAEMVCWFGSALQSKHHAGEPNVLDRDSIRPPRRYLLAFSASFR